MSAPGTPPETGGYLEDEAAPAPDPSRAAGGVPNLFGPQSLSQTGDLPLTTDERFAPGSPANRVGQLTAPETPDQLPEAIRPRPQAPLVGPPRDPNVEQEPQLSGRPLPAPRTGASLLSPTPIEEQATPLGTSGRIRKGVAFSPEPIAEQNPRLRNAVARGPETDPDSSLGRAVDRATGMVGMHERVNQRDIANYLKTGGAGMDPAKTAWCAAFVNASLKQGGVEGSGSQVATSFLKWGQPVTGRPEKGDVVVEHRGRKAGQTGGHVGITTGRTRDGPNGPEIEVISGNTSNKVSRDWEPLSKVAIRRGIGVNTSRVGGGGNLVDIPGSSAAPVPGQLLADQDLEEQPVVIKPGDTTTDVAVKTPTLQAPAPLNQPTNKPTLEAGGSYPAAKNTITVVDTEGQYVNIPTVRNGQPIDPKSAAKLYRQGKNPPVNGPFPTLEQAITAAQGGGSASVEPPTVAAPVTAQQAVAQPITGGPVYAPEGTPLEELERLSQTKPWGSKQGVLRSWKKSQLGASGDINEFRGVVPSEMGGVEPVEPPEPTLEGDAAYNALEPKFEEPLYVKPPYDYDEPPYDVTEIEPMPLSPPELAAPPAEITRSGLVSRPVGNEPIASPQRYRFIAPEKSLPLDNEGQPSIAQLGLQLAQDAIGDPTVGIRRFGQGFQSSVGQMIYMLPASVNAIKALPYALATGEVHPHDREQVEFWLRRMGEAETGSRKLWGFDPNVNPEGGEKLYQMAGESVIPAKAWTLPLSILNLGVRAVIDPHSPVSLNPVSEAEAAPGDKPKKKGKPTFAEAQAAKDQIIDRATGLPMADIPGQLENGNVIAGSISGPVFGTPIPQPDGTVLLVPNASIRGDRNLTGDEAVAQYARTQLNYGLFDSVESANQYLKILNSRVTQTVQTASGPQQMKVSDLALLGSLGALTAGMAFGPKLYNQFRSGKLPVLTPDMGTPVKNAEPGTTSYTRLRDFYHTTVHDFYAAPKNLLKRSGATPEQIFDFDVRYANTRGGATNVAQSIITTNHGSTPEFNYNAKNARPIGELVKAGEAPEVKQYLYLLNTFEDIIQTQKQTIASQGAVPKGVNPKEPNPGPVTIRDWTEDSIKPAIKKLETDYPHVRPLAAELKSHNRELLRVESTGRWATKTKAEAKEEAITHQYRVDYGKHNWEDANPFVLLSNSMNERIRIRLENAAHAPFVDYMNTARPGAFVETSPARVGPKQFANWEPNTIKVYEGGMPKHYTTDPLLASTMKLDPHYYQSAPGAASVVRWLSAPKRAFEVGTTRWLAPWFAVTNMRRNHNLIALATPGESLKRPYIHQSLAEVHRDIIPQITNGLAKSFDSTGLIGRTLGQNTPAWLDALGKRWANSYIDSNHARIQMRGGNYGSSYDHRITTDRVMNDSIRNATGETAVFLRGLQNFLGAVHGAPTNATVRKNWYRTELPTTDPNYMHPNDLVTRARRLTGDPVVQGERFGAGNIRFNASTAEEKVALMGLKGLGAGAELARVMIPWFNTTVQGIKGVGRSYVKSPGKFTSMLWATQLFPVGMIYAWNQSLGRDSQGVSYSNHAMNGRTPYNTMMSHYIGIPGRPASEGMELPFKVHELSLFQRWFEIALDHMFSDPKHTAMEDWKYMWKSWTNVAGDVPFPTLANWVLAYTGNTPAQGMTENNTFKVRESPYDQNKGLPVNVELMMRAMGGGIADVLGSGAAAMIQEENTFLKPSSGIKEMGFRAAQKTPILRDVFNIAPPISGNTRAAQEMFEYRDALRQLDEHFRNYGTGGGRKLSNKPASGMGGLIVRGQLGPASPEIAPGLPQPMSTNPMYNTWMKMVHDKITSDVPEKGGMGYKSAMVEYFKTTKELATLRNITTANNSAWQRWINMEQNKPLIEFLEKNNVNHKNPTAVINFYQGRRQATMEVILKMFKSVEHEISKKTGRPFNIGMLKPYSKLDDLPPIMKRDEVKELTEGFYAGTAVPE